MRQQIFDFSPRRRPTFGNYFPGPNLAALQLLEQSLDGGFGEAVVYLHGEDGVGKSHLLSAWVDEAGRRGLGAGFGPLSEAAFVAVDDVELLDAEGEQALFALINRVKDRGGMVLAAGSLAPAFLPMRADVRSRLGWGLVFRLLPLADADKAEVLRGIAAQRGYRLGGEVVTFLLRHACRDLPALIEALARVEEEALASKRDITVPLVKSVLGL